MSLGGSEAIVESFYSVMGSQQKVCSSMQPWTMLDWSASTVLNVEVVQKAAKLYVDGSSELKL